MAIIPLGLYFNSNFFPLSSLYFSVLHVFSYNSHVSLYLNNYVLSLLPYKYNPPKRIAILISEELKLKAKNIIQKKVKSTIHSKIKITLLDTLPTKS